MLGMTYSIFFSFECVNGFGDKTMQVKNKIRQKSKYRDQKLVKYRSDTSKKFRKYLVVKFKAPHLNTSRKKLRPCSWSCLHSRPVYSIWAQFYNLSYQCFLWPLLRLPWRFLTSWIKFSSLSDFYFHWGQFLSLMRFFGLDFGLFKFFWSNKKFLFWSCLLTLLYIGRVEIKSTDL